MRHVVYFAESKGI